MLFIVVFESNCVQLYSMEHLEALFGNLRVTVVVVDLHERDVADVLVEHAVHSSAHVRVRCRRGGGGGRVVIMVVMVVAKVVNNLVAPLVDPVKPSEALRLRNRVEHLCVFVAAGESWQSGRHGCR